MADSEHEARDLGPAWRWGVWIGCVLLGVGILAFLFGVGLIGGVASDLTDGPEVHAPGALHRLVRSGASLTLQGVLSTLIGGGMLTLSLLKLRAIRIRRQEEQHSWRSPDG